VNEFIRESMGWTVGQWPPDFYGLLGLHSHIVNADEVEAAVLSRMEKLRTYQLIQPESVTEAMNLLARALITLSDPVAKAEYDRELAGGGEQEPEVRGQGSAVGSRESGVESRELAAENLPTEIIEPPSVLTSPPLREGPKKVDSPPPIPIEPRFSPTVDLPPPLPIRTATEFERSIIGEWLPAPDPRRPKRSSAFRRRGGPRRERIRWVVQLRQLLRAWDDAGDWFAIPDLAFATRIEAVNLIIALREIARKGPIVIGTKGPGSAILSLAESRPNSTELMEIADARREFLAKDWRAGRANIFDDYSYARDQFSRRRRSRSWHTTWTRHASTVMLGLVAFSTIVVLLWRAVRG